MESTFQRAMPNPGKMVAIALGNLNARDPESQSANQRCSVFQLVSTLLKLIPMSAKVCVPMQLSA